jgi:hypothetical protein
MFESQPALSGIAGLAFSQTGLIQIIFSSLVEVLGESRFYECASLSSVTFESGSRLSRIESWTFI